jgi:hypothetical protein
VTGLPKFWLVCLITTGWAASASIVTGNRRRSTGTVRTRGGMRRPANCIVAIRKFIAATSATLRTIPEA